MKILQKLNVLILVVGFVFFGTLSFFAWWSTNKVGIHLFIKIANWLLGVIVVGSVVAHLLCLLAVSHFGLCGLFYVRGCRGSHRCWKSIFINGIRYRGKCYTVAALICVSSYAGGLDMQLAEFMIIIFNFYVFFFGDDYLRVLCSPLSVFPISINYLSLFSLFLLASSKIFFFRLSLLI